MKGLILKDIYNLSGQFKIYLLMPFLAAFFCYQNESLSFLQFMLGLVVVFIPLSAFAYDEMCSFDSYAVTLPISRKDLVLSRYVLSLLTTLAVGVIAVIVAFIMVMIFGAAYFENVEMKAFIIEEIFVCLAINGVVCILLPLLFKFGSEKGRIVLMLIFMCFGVLPFVFKDQLANLSFGNLDGNVVMWAVAGILLFIEVVSIYMSNHIVAKKEF